MSSNRLHEKVHHGWMYQTEDGRFVKVVLDKEGYVLGYKTVDFGAASWVDQEDPKTEHERQRMEKVLGRPVKAVPVRITVRRELLDEVKGEE